MADDRCQSYQSTSPRERRAWWKSGHGTHKRGLNTKIHLAVDAHGMPIRFLSQQVPLLIVHRLVPDRRSSAEYLLADRGYDSRRVIEKALRAGTNVVIPPRKNRKEQRDYDRYLYKLRHLVENAFLHLKRWRGIATRYAKLTSSFVAAVQIRCIVLWVSTLI